MHRVGPLLTLNHDARNHVFKKKVACKLAAGKRVGDRTQPSHLRGFCIDWDALCTKFLL